MIELLCRWCDQECSPDAIRADLCRDCATPPEFAQWLDSLAAGVAYCGDEVWTIERWPQRPDRWEPHDEPVAEWLIDTLSSDAVSPDTSQPYPLDDLIARIDELT